jgi:hypothetical protein
LEDAANGLLSNYLGAGFGGEGSGEGGSSSMERAARVPKVAEGPGGDIAKVGLITGASGVGVAAGGFALASIQGGSLMAGMSWASTAGMTSPALMGFSGALVGAGIGMAATGLLIDVTGIGRGLDPITTYTLVGAGAISAGIVGFELFTSGLTGMCTVGGGVGCIVFVVVIVVILLLWAFGIGDIKTVKMSFECKPWQPPLGGGGCERCGTEEDGIGAFPCNKYACESLGQSCQYVNDGTDEAACVDSGRGDSSAPQITDER